MLLLNRNFLIFIDNLLRIHLPKSLQIDLLVFLAESFRKNIGTNYKRRNSFFFSKISNQP